MHVDRTQRILEAKMMLIGNPFANSALIIFDLKPGGALTLNGGQDVLFDIGFERAVRGLPPFL